MSKSLGRKFSCTLALTVANLRQRVAQMANLRPVDDLLLPAVKAAVAALTLADEDAATVRLAQRYAATIDEAATLAYQLSMVEYDDEQTAQRVNALAKRVEAHAVMAELGPKLLVALEALGASPAARARMKGGGPASGSSRLAALRAARTG